MATSESAAVISVSSIQVITSPCSSPAAPAAEPSATSCTSAPSVDLRAGVRCALRAARLDADVADRDAEPGVGGGLAVAHLVDDRQHLVDGDREAETDRAGLARPGDAVLRIEELMPTS